MRLHLFVPCVAHRIVVVIVVVVDVVVIIVVVVAAADDVVPDPTAEESCRTDVCC
jgi:hypothetical protein